MKTIYALLIPLLALLTPTVGKGQTLTLDSCRRLALANNKTIAIGAARSEKAYYDHRTARTNYLPKVSGTASYLRIGKEISLLSSDQQASLSTMGTAAGTQLQQGMMQLVQQYPDLAALAGQAGGYLPSIADALNGVGQELVDAFHTDTRDMAVGAILLKQPLYMGGKIRAYDRLTHYAQDVAAEQQRADAHEVVLEADRAYWQVVSLANKRRLAVSYRDMLQHLDDDLHKMMAEGVATRANELSVSVRLNEAEMALTKVDNGLVLSRMLLCQVCGLPLDSDIIPADEALDDIDVTLAETTADTTAAFAARPELQQLLTATHIYREKERITRADFLPQLALMGGAFTTYPSLTNGFERRFRGTWAVGISLQVPIWNWREGAYKLRAARAETRIAGLQLSEAREKIALQVTQAAQRVEEAHKQYALSRKNLEKATENLRTARLGFDEGVIAVSDLLAAQTAWVQAHSEKIDAQVGIRLTRATLHHVIGSDEGR